MISKLSAVEYPIAFTKTPGDLNICVMEEYVVSLKPASGSLAGPFEDVPLSKVLPEIDYEVIKTTQHLTITPKISSQIYEF